MKIVKQIEWDMGHRVTNHKSKCRNLHGHRYKLQVCVSGEVIEREGSSDEGMVIDFGDIKEIINKNVYYLLDHGFIVWKKDKILVDFFKKNSDQKYVIFPHVPTVERIAEWIFGRLNLNIKDKYGTGLKLFSVKLWETPKSFAEFTVNDYLDVKGKK